MKATNVLADFLMSKNTHEQLRILPVTIDTIQGWHFRGCLRMGGCQKGPLPKIVHISYNDETWHSYILPKEDPKNI